MTYRTEVHTELRNRAWSVQIIRDWPGNYAVGLTHARVTPASMERLRRWLIAQLSIPGMAMEVAKKPASLLYDARISYVIEWPEGGRLL